MDLGCWILLSIGKKNGEIKRIFAFRMKKNDHLKEICEYAGTVFDLLKQTPTHNIPFYFTKLIFDLINIVEIKTLTNIKTPKIKLQTKFLQKLLLSTYQFLGFLDYLNFFMIIFYFSFFLYFLIIFYHFFIIFIFFLIFYSFLIIFF